MGNETAIIPVERIEGTIIVLRGRRVILDENLAELYEVEVKVLNQAVKRNIERFPEDFMFQLNDEEALFLRSQFVTIKRGRGQHRKYRPLAFTEQGVAMLSSVLHSERAIQINILIMRAFVKIKQALATHVEVSRKLKELEGRLDKHDGQIFAILDAIRKMVEPDPKPAKRIGFVVE